jgi:hypothetical protein
VPLSNATCGSCNRARSRALRFHLSTSAIA